MADPLSVSSGVAGILALTGTVVATCYSYGCAVRDAPRELQELVEEMMSLSGVLNAVKALVDGTTAAVAPELSSNLSDSFSSADLPPPYAVTDARRYLSQVTGPIEGCKTALQDVQSALRKAEVRDESRLNRIVKRLIWPLKRDETLDLVRRVERYKTAFALSLDTAGLSITLDTQRTLNSIRYDQVSDRLERRSAEQAAANQRLFKWLCPINFTEAHRAAQQLHLQGTASWVLEEPAWKSWMQEDRSFLWLSGIPGSGKTVLTSRLLDNCTLPDAKAPECLAYFYCDFRNKDTQRPEVILGALIAQFFAQLQEDVPEVKYLQDKHSSLGNDFSKPTYEELEDLLLVLLGRMDRAIIVIDALDECIERIALLNLLSSLAKRKDYSVKILVSSRQYGDIEEALVDFKRLSTQTDAQHADIEFYVSCSMAQSARLRRLPPDLRDTVRTTLVQDACGMFRWVQCQIEALDRLRTDRDVRRAVGQLPRTLYGAYERILERIDTADRTVARRALLWLAYSPRTLTLAELAEAVVIEDDTVARDPEAAWYPTDLLSVIGSLARYTSDSTRVELAHHSVKEFLETAPLQEPLSFFHLEAVAGRAELAQCLLRYLLMRDFAEPCRGLDGFQARLQTYPLFHLAARYWPYYARLSLADGDKVPTYADTLQLSAQLVPPRDPPGQFASWVEALVAQGPVSFAALERHGQERPSGTHAAIIAPPLRWRRPPSRPAPLYYAASFGLTPLVEHLIALGAPLDARGGRFSGTALHAAVFRNHEDVATVLLHAGARFDVRDDNGMTARTMAYQLDRQPRIRALLRAASADALESQKMDWPLLQEEGDDGPDQAWWEIDRRHEKQHAGDHAPRQQHGPWITARKQHAREQKQQEAADEALQPLADVV